MSEIGWATMPVIPTFKGLQQNLERGSAKALALSGTSGGVRFGEAAGTSAAKGFSSKFGSILKRAGGLAGLGAGFGVASFIKDSVQLEAQFGKTMAQIGVATGVPKKQLAELNDLAIKLGKDTVFSASDASQAMLELAKNGIKPATIQGGALKSALTLAASGGVDLTEAATTMGNSLNAFALRARKAKSVAAALAGAANASSASVASIAEGLQQSAAGAHNAGLSIQETTAVLAAFANKGIQGSDAGTSLKTMLTNLVPATDKASTAMEEVGLWSDKTGSKFVNLDGSFKSITEISGLLNDKLSELSESQRSAALQTIFGSDATRAATVLMDEGAKGIRGYIKATSDQSQAEKLAKANMEGTAGAIERLKGSWETAKLQFGQFIAPAVVTVLDKFSDGIDGAGPKLAKLRDDLTPLAQSALPALNTGLKTARDVLEKLAPLAKGLFDAFNSLPKAAQTAILVGGGAAALAKKTGVLGSGKGAGSGLLGMVTTAKPLPVYVVNNGVGGGLPGKGKVTPGSLAKDGKFLTGLGPYGALAAGTLVGGVALNKYAPRAAPVGRPMSGKIDAQGPALAAPIIKAIGGKLDTEPLKKAAFYSGLTRQNLAKLPEDFNKGMNGAEALKSQVFGIESSTKRSRAAVVSLVDALEAARQQAVRVEQAVSAARSSKVDGQLGRGVTVIHNGNIVANSPRDYHTDAQRRSRRAATDGIRNRAG